MNKPDDTPGSDTDLSPLLRTWQVRDSLDAGFRARVWRRIAREDPAAGLRLRAVVGAWLDRLFARPSWSVAYALLLLGAGLIAGYWQASEQTARWDEVMATRYMRSIDPSFDPTLEP